MPAESSVLTSPGITQVNATPVVAYSGSAGEISFDADKPVRQFVRGAGIDGGKGADDTGQAGGVTNSGPETRNTGAATTSNVTWVACSAKVIMLAPSARISMPSNIVRAISP